MPAAADPAAAAPFTAADRGFAPQPDGSRRTRRGDRTIAFRPLRRLPALRAGEALQRQVFGVPRWVLLGGRSKPHLTISHVVSLGEPAAMAAAAARRFGKA